MNEHTYIYTNGQTERQKLYTPRHKYRGKSYMVYSVVKDYMSLSKERNWSLQTFPYLISQQDFQSLRLSIKDYLEQITTQGIVHEPI